MYIQQAFPLQQQITLQQFEHSMVTSTPLGLLARSKREHPFHLSGIHTQQSLTNWHFISWPIWSPYQAILVPQHNCGEPPRTHSLRSSFLLDTQRHKASYTLEAYSQELKHLRTQNTINPLSNFITAIYM